MEKSKKLNNKLKILGIVSVVLILAITIFISLTENNNKLVLPETESILDNETPLSKGFFDDETEEQLNNYINDNLDDDSIKTLLDPFQLSPSNLSNIVYDNQAGSADSSQNNNNNNEGTKDIENNDVVTPGDNNNTTPPEEDKKVESEMKKCPVCSFEYSKDLDECPNCAKDETPSEHEIVCPLCGNVYYDIDEEAECPECHGIHPDLIIKDDAPEDALRCDINFNVYDQNYDSVSDIDYILKRDSNTVGVEHVSYGQVTFNNQAIIEGAKYTLLTLDREPCAEFEAKITQDEYAQDNYKIELSIKKVTGDRVDDKVELNPIETTEYININGGYTNWHMIYVFDDYKDDFVCDYCGYVYRHMKYSNCPICNDEGLTFTPDIIVNVSDDEKSLPLSYKLTVISSDGKEDVYQSEWEKDSTQSLKLNIPFQYNETKEFTLISDAIPYHPISFTITLNNKSSWYVENLSYDQSVNGDWQVNGYYWNGNITFTRDGHQQYNSGDITQCIKCGENTFGYQNDSSEPYCSNCGWCLKSITLFCDTCKEYHHLCMHEQHSIHNGYTELMDSKDCSNHDITNSGKDTTSYELAEHWCDKHPEEHGYWYYLTENENYQRFPGNAFGLACVDCLNESIEKGTFSGYSYCSGENCYHQYDMLLYSNCPWCGSPRELAIPFENENVDSWYIVKNPETEVYAAFTIEMHDEYYPRTYKAYTPEQDDRWVVIDKNNKLCAISDWGSNKVTSGVISIGGEYTVMLLSDYTKGNLDTPVKAEFSGIESETLGSGLCSVCNHSQSGSSGIGQWTTPLQHTVATCQTRGYGSPAKIGCENANLNPQSNSYWDTTVYLEFEWGDSVTCDICDFYDHAYSFAEGCPKCGGNNEYNIDEIIIKSTVEEKRDSETSDYWYVKTDPYNYYSQQMGVSFNDCNLMFGDYNYNTGESAPEYPFIEEIEEIDSLNRNITYTVRIPAQTLTYKQMINTNLNINGSPTCGGSYSNVYMSGWNLYGTIEKGVLKGYQLSTPYIDNYDYMYYYSVMLNLIDNNTYELSVNRMYNGGGGGMGYEETINWTCPVCEFHNRSTYYNYGGGMTNEDEKYHAMSCTNCRYQAYYDHAGWYSHCDDCNHDYVYSGECLYCKLRGNDWDCPLCSNHVSNYIFTSGSYPTYESFYYYSANTPSVCSSCSYDKNHAYQQCPVCNNNYYYYDSSSSKYLCLWCKRFGVVSVFSLENDCCEHQDSII